MNYAKAYELCQEKLKVILQIIRARVDMVTKYRVLINKMFGTLLLLQPEVYLITNPDTSERPTSITVQVIWNSIFFEKHTSVTIRMESKENYDRSLYRLKIVFQHAIADSRSLGNSPFMELIGVNYN